MSELKHYGVKGMHWGVRRYQNYDGTRIGAKHRSGEKSVVRKAVAKGTNNEPLGEKAKKTLNQKRLERAAKASNRDADDLEKHGYKEEAKAVRQVAEKNLAKAQIAGKISDTSVVKKQIRNERNEKLFTSQEKRVSRDARKDAEEFARAKAFYGEGAGNRRKAIKTTVEAKKKKDPFYAQEFDWHLAQQDMEYHMKKATAERKRKDAVKGIKSTNRKLERGMQFASRFF